MKLDVINVPENIYKKKQVSTYTPWSRTERALLQVFKYFSAKEIASVLSRVSKYWYQISWKNEIWKPRLDQEHPEYQIDKNQPTEWRELFVWIQVRS